MSEKIKNSVLGSDHYTYDYFRLDYVCRLCWGTDGVTELTSGGSKSIKDDDTSIGIDATIAEKILECVGVDVTTHSFPKKVCTKCVNDVEVFTEFKRFCQETNRKLLNILKKSSSEQIESLKDEKDDKIDDPMIFKEETDLLHKIQSLETKFQENLHKAMRLEFSNYEIDDIDQHFDDVPVEFPKNKKTCKISDNLEKKKKLKCSTCHLDFEAAEKLTEHNMKCHGLEENGFFKCYGCGKRFKDLNLRLIHQSKTCQSCTKIFSEKLYKCCKCPETFKNSESLIQHKKQNHKKQNHKRSKCICEICGKVCSNKGNLVMHQYRHEKVKRFQCAHCDYRAAQPSSMAVHIRRHTGERPYACDLCPQRCISSSNLTKHRKLHFKIKEFECNICKKQFNRKLGLEEHISAVHQNAKEHICPNCGSQYSIFSSLREHILVKHGLKVRKCGDEIIEVASGIVYKRKWKKKTQ